MIPADVFAEVLASRDFSKCLAELEEVSVSTLWPRSGTLRALASLLTVEDIKVNKAAASYLSSGASSSHFKARVSALACWQLLLLFFFIQCKRSSNHTSVFLFLFSLWVAAGGGVLHPGAVRGRRSEPKSRLLGSQLPAGQLPCRSHYRLGCHFSLS